MIQPAMIDDRGVLDRWMVAHCTRLRGSLAVSRRPLGDISPAHIATTGRGLMETCMSIPSLYERLGGVYNIAVVVDDFIDRVMDDPRLNANPKVDEAHHRVSRQGFKYLVTEMVCWATGGPQKYSGKSMYDSHAHLDITEGEWQAFIDDFTQTMNRFEVPTAERAELRAIVESTKKDIVLAK